MKLRKAHKNKAPKIIFTTLGIIILIPIVVVGSYVGYVAGSYYRIGDQKNLKIDKGTATVEKVKVGEELTATSFNVGFGAYSKNFSFFMDRGIEADGTLNTGYYGKAISKEDVLKNMTGMSKAAKKIDSDFILFQEVDVDATRSYHVNQNEFLKEDFSEYDSTMCLNFDSAYLFYPLYDPHGKSKAGLNTYSKYALHDFERKEYTIATDFSKFFDLDRCFSVQRTTVDNGKELVIINSHMSAYDEGGKIRNKQIHELNDYMKQEMDKGNYVVCGGDFNHDLLTNNPMYPQYTKVNFPFKDMVTQLKPDWISFMFEDDGSTPFDSRLKIIASDNEPSCRGCDIPWERGYTFVTEVDGFIVSDNVNVKKVVTTRVDEPDGFTYSDHQPVTITFELK